MKIGVRVLLLSSSSSFEFFSCASAEGAEQHELTLLLESGQRQPKKEKKGFQNISNYYGYRYVEKPNKHVRGFQDSRIPFLA